MATPAMRIDILGLPHRGTAENQEALIKISCNGSRHVGPLPFFLIPNREDHLLPLLRWHIEDFATLDSFNAAKFRQSKEKLIKYGRILLAVVLRIMQHPKNLVGSRIVIKVSDKWVGSSLPIQTATSGANIVSLIQWECLEMLEMWPDNYRPETVSVVRSTTCIELDECIVTPSPSPSPSSSSFRRRVLALSSRSARGQDIPHRLVTRTIQKVVETVRSRMDAAPELEIARPGTLEGLEKALAEKPVGYFDIVHLDVHGVANDDE